MQGTEILDASEDQDSTDLHKCVDYIHDLANVDNTNVGLLLWYFDSVRISCLHPFAS